MSVHVRRAGLLSTVQDLGRYGRQHLGIVPSGAMDEIAHRVANALVGNDDDAATLECTIVGPELEFGEDTLVAIYGAAFEGKNALPGNRPVLVKRGTTIRLGTAVRGARAYLAVAGGFDVPPVLGSRATYVPAAFGGFLGRALKTGDSLSLRRNEMDQRFSGLRDTVETTSFSSVRWSAPELTLPGAGTLTARVMEGRHYAQFDDSARNAFHAELWRVSANSNRMGYRLEGPRLRRARQVENLSEPTCLGTVQVPSDGAPIVLMADHQTTGGYPKIAEVASADMPSLAQLAPGGVLRFVRCSVEEAQLAEDARIERLRQVKNAIRERLGC